MKLIALIAACLSTAVLADVTVTTVGDKDGKPWSVTYIASGKFRSDSMRGAEPGYVIWQNGSQQMTVVSPNKKTYMVMDRAQLQAQMAQVNEQMKQLEAQMAAMPPEQREMMKKMMPNMGTGKPLIDMKVTKTGKSDNKGGYACQMVDITITGLPMTGPMGQEHCVVPGAKLGVADADIATVRAMADYSKQLMKDIGQVVGGMPDIMEMGGWPVWTKDKRTGDSWTLKSIDKGAIAASMFEVPAGYTKQEMPTIGGKQPGH